jgi:hypothetical protein
MTDPCEELIHLMRRSLGDILYEGESEVKCFNVKTSWSVNLMVSG